MYSHQTYLVSLSLKIVEYHSSKVITVTCCYTTFFNRFLRGSLLIKSVCKTIIDLCNFCRDIYSKDYSENNYKQLENRVETTFCCLELLSFFDVIIHLTIHLVDKKNNRQPHFGGPVSARLNVYKNQE